MTRTRRAGPVLPILLMCGVLAGCGGPSIDGSGEQGFVTSDGVVNVLAAADREPPAAEVAGESVDGRPLALADHAGDVVVMPVWGSWCAPCRAEAPMLADAARDLAGEGVTFLGINNRDTDAASARRFVDGFDIPYDSIYDPDGNLLLAFRGTLPPMAVPSLVVMDADGKVAARVLGEVERSTLYGVVEDVLGREIES